MEEYDVFISGAGPVGLFFAYQLATLGHSFYICDKKPGPIAQSRAVLMTSRTVEVLENRGIAHHLLKESVVSQGIQIHFDGKKVGTIDAINEGTSFPQLTLLAQDKAETVFVHLLESKGGTIHWNTGLKSYKQFDDHIEAVVEDPQGGEQTIRAKYIIGADGAHSMVRKVTPDWKYEGHSIATKFAIADVVLEGEDAYKLRNQRMNMFGSGQNGFCLVIPLGRDSLDGPYRYRIVVNLGPYEEEKEKKENGSSQRVTHGIAGANSFSIEELQKLLDIRLKPLNVKARDSLWTSQFRINERMADGFRRKRAFLIGDAAHCHSPAGGQGLNLGYQDADNLAWKLSLVLSGVSSDPEKLLDSYTTEREPTVKMTLQIAGGLTRLMTNSNWIMSYIIRISLGAVLSLDTVKHNAVFRLMQLNLRIQPNSPILFHNPASSLLVKTGDFLPDTNVLRRRIMHDRIERQTIRQILSGNGAKHTILWLCSRPSKYPPCPWTGIFWDKLVNLKYSDKAVRPLVVESTWHVHEYRLPEYVTTGSKDLLENAFWMEDHPDSPESLTKRLGFSDEQGTAAAIVIVRPDLYIAHTSMIRSPADIDPALSTLSIYLQTFN